MKYPNTRKKYEGEEKGKRKRVGEPRAISKQFLQETLATVERTAFSINSEIIQ